MDRNTQRRDFKRLGLVALRKESVDRNHVRNTTSTRPSVALRKESVDRNINEDVSYNIKETVALRKESVDRNLNAMQVVIIIVSRSPQGERG